MEVWHWILIGLGVVTLIALASKWTSSANVSDAEKRRLMNLEDEKKLEGFLLHYPRLRRGDFEGAFAIHNSSQDKWFVDCSSTVYHEAMEIFSGNLRPYAIYRDIQDGDFFSIRAIPLAGSGYHNRQELRRALESAYATGKKKY